MVNQVRTYACLPNQDWTPDKVSRLPDTKVLYNLKLFHIYYIKTEQILEMRKIYKEQQKYIAIIGSVFSGILENRTLVSKFGIPVIPKFLFCLSKLLQGNWCLLLISESLMVPSPHYLKDPQRKSDYSVSGQNEYSVIGRSGVEVLNQGCNTYSDAGMLREMVSPVIWDRIPIIFLVKRQIFEIAHQP